MNFALFLQDSTFLRCLQRTYSFGGIRLLFDFVFLQVYPFWCAGLTIKSATEAFLSRSAGCIARNFGHWHNVLGQNLTEVGFEPTPEDQCLKLAP